MLKDTVLSFIEDEALSRGAAIAFYTVTSVAPLLLIVIAIAGLAFGREAAQNAIVSQLSGLMGQQPAQVLETAVASASGKSSGILATDFQASWPLRHTLICERPGKPLRPAPSLPTASGTMAACVTR